MNRPERPSRECGKREPWDMVIVGGGATGVGVAVDAASRGYEALLPGQNDFGKGTSSRSTKLVHGGVRYLEQGNISLVREVLLRGRGRLGRPLRNGAYGGRCAGAAHAGALSERSRGHDYGPPCRGTDGPRTRMR